MGKLRGGKVEEEQEGGKTAKPRRMEMYIKDGKATYASNVCVD